MKHLNSFSKNVITFIKNSFTRKSDGFIVSYILFIFFCFIMLFIWDDATILKVVTGVSIVAVCFTVSDFLHFISSTIIEFADDEVVFNLKCNKAKQNILMNDINHSKSLIEDLKKNHSTLNENCNTDDKIKVHNDNIIANSKKKKS